MMWITINFKLKGFLYTSTTSMHTLVLCVECSSHGLESDLQSWPLYYFISIEYCLMKTLPASQTARVYLIETVFV